VCSSDLEGEEGVPASYLVVAGGGGGGSGDGNGGGGGGGGGYQASTLTLSTLNTYTITVGAGGNGGSNPSSGSQGSNSVISGTGITTVTSTGGGAGADGQSNGGNGGSGGGGGGGVATTGGTGTSGQGNNGGAGVVGGSLARPGGGGGGASAAGSNGGSSPNYNGGNGGNGSSSSISGSSVTYAGGGGAGTGTSSTSAGSGGTGGGGAGKKGLTTGDAGTANTGGGGGGSGTTDGNNGGNGGAGGSGVVIISYTSATPRFVGGTLTTSGGNQIHTFTSSGTLSPLTPVTASYLVVAGGGGAGTGNVSGLPAGAGGGGGAGGLLTSSTTLYSGATYVVTVGAGGAAGTLSSSNGSNGANSVISGTGLTTITSTGGGGGGIRNGSAATAGSSGGSGGGGGFRLNAAGGAGTSGQGNAGGNSQNSSTSGQAGGGGGGGASAAGQSSPSDNVGGNGGAGTASSISGSSVTYAGGGGGGSYGGTAGSGGTGGGGAGSNVASGTGTAGTANLGGGGGGGGDQGYGAAGGSGTVIISYAGSQLFNGGLVTSSGGNTIHTFTATGALTPVTNNLTNSLRFRSSASAYLSRTPTLTGNRQKWTFSCWVKRGASGVRQGIFVAQTSGGVYWGLEFETGNNLNIYDSNAGGSTALTTTALYRDFGAWYHVVVAEDTTQATASNRCKIYVNGNQVTSFVTADYPAQNSNTEINLGGLAHRIGNWSSANLPLDGYLADVNFIDGQALEPYYFGNNDANGVWKPIKYTGMYGTNGFYLTFADTTSTTTIGYDTSGNNNNWTANNISLTAGVTYDAMTDVPTNTSATVSNYCVLNPLQKYSGLSAPTNGNLTIAGNSANWRSILSTFAVSSGKWYCEINMTSVSTDALVGIFNINNASDLNDLTTVDNRQLARYSGGYGYQNNGNKVNNNTGTSYGATWTTGDVIAIALDMDAGTITFYKNNTSQGTAYSSLSGLFAIGISTANGTFNANFGQRPFAYTPPTGFVALNTFNLPTPTILQGNKYMDATLFTATAGSNVIVNAGAFKPDLVWFKARSNAQDHYVVDSVRGGSSLLRANTTAAENTSAVWINSFNSNGFTTDTATLVTTGYTYVAWNWQAGQGSTSSNTSGTITSTVSVSTTAGFSVVTYTGNGSSSGTFGHGLGVAPAMFIIKSRSQTGENWVTWHKSFSNTAQGNMSLNTTGAVSNSASVWGNTAPTSTLITVGNSAVNNNTSTYVAYCWSEIAGFSKFGSYTGNGSTDGVFVYTGFRPAFILIKRTSATEDWFMFDNKRLGYNADNNYLYSDLSNAEGTVDYIDIVSNGFKMRSTSTAVNSGDYIYMAFAENPFKNSNAR
jgi:hypothetical protein